MSNWTPKEIDWNKDLQPLRDLFNTTWTGNAITQAPYFKWYLLDNFAGKPVGYYAEPEDRHDIIAGVYLVLRNSLYYGDAKYDFSVSMYTTTHPDYYRKGIFKRLANETYEKCVEEGIMGTIGVPNNNSLPGFARGLEFDVIGQFEMLARIASPNLVANEKIKIREINSQKDFEEINFNLDRQKAASGMIIGERSAEFILWRYLLCPIVSYQVFATLGADNSLTGLLVLRKAKRRRMPITVIVDFIIDHTRSDSGEIAETLLARTNRYAWKHFSPLIMTSLNPESPEFKVLKNRGYKKLPKKILPHDSNFILKLHGYQSAELVEDFRNFNNWYFSFADYDIF